MLEVTRTCQSCGINRATFIRIMDNNKLPNQIMLLCLDCVNQLNIKSSVNSVEMEVEKILDRHM